MHLIYASNSAIKKLCFFYDLEFICKIQEVLPSCLVIIEVMCECVHTVHYTTFATPKHCLSCLSAWQAFGLKLCDERQTLSILFENVFV